MSLSPSVARRVSVQRRGPKTKPAEAELERLQRENQRLREKLERTELIIDAQKKVVQFVEIEFQSENEEK